MFPLHPQLKLARCVAHIFTALEHRDHHHLDRDRRVPGRCLPRSGRQAIWHRRIAKRIKQDNADPSSGILCLRRKIMGIPIVGRQRSGSFGAELRHHDAGRRRTVRRDGQRAGGRGAAPDRNLHRGRRQSVRHGRHLFVRQVGGSARPGAGRAPQGHRPGHQMLSSGSNPAPTRPDSPAATSSKPARPVCAVSAPITSISTRPTTSIRSRRSTKPCAPSTIWSAPARSATSAAPTTPAGNS